MIDYLRITVVVENTAGRPDMLAEHGLALRVEAEGQTLLFDTGQGPALPRNARALGIDLGDVQQVVLSHGHYDHSGGLAANVDALRSAAVYVHPAAFDAKFSVSGGVAHFNGAAFDGIDGLRKRVADVVLTPVPVRIRKGIWVTGEIPRRHTFEDVGGPFFRDEAGQVPDTLPDDQAMYIETQEGVVVLLGCAHAGLVNTLDYVARLSGQSRLHAVLGGMHLAQASEARIDRSVEALRRYGTRLVAPCHCTGQRAASAMRHAFPDGFRDVSAASVIEIGHPRT